MTKKYANGGICHIRKDLRGKVVIVTGANTGIGRETALELASMGATIVLACRSRERTQAVLDEIAQRYQNARAVFIPLELSDLDSVRQFAQEF